MACRATANAYFSACFFYFFKTADLAKKLMHGLFAHRAGVDEDEVGLGDVLSELVVLFLFELGDDVLAIADVHRAA